DFLAPAPEDEWIAALQPHNRLSGADAADDLDFDITLTPTDLSLALADRHELGFASRPVENCLWYEFIVQDGIGLLQELCGPQRQEVRIARPGAHDVGDADWFQPSASVIEVAQCHASRGGIVAREHKASRRAFDEATPIVATPRRVDDQRFGLRTESLGKPSERSDALGQKRLDP